MSFTDFEPEISYNPYDIINELTWSNVGEFWYGWVLCISWITFCIIMILLLAYPEQTRILKNVPKDRPLIANQNMVYSHITHKGESIREIAKYRSIKEMIIVKASACTLFLIHLCGCTFVFGFNLSILFLIRHFWFCFCFVFVLFVLKSALVFYVVKGPIALPEDMYQTEEEKRLDAIFETGKTESATIDANGNIRENSTSRSRPIGKFHIKSTNNEIIAQSASMKRNQWVEPPPIVKIYQLWLLGMRNDHIWCGLCFRDYGTNFGQGERIAMIMLKFLTSAAVAALLSDI